MKFDFSFGQKEKTIIQWAVISVVLTTIVTGIHRCTGISEKNIWNLIDEAQREASKRHIPGTENLNNYIIHTPELLNQRVERDVVNAISNYERWEREHFVPRIQNKDILNEIRKPKYTESQRRVVEGAVYYECKPNGSHAQELLGGAQGIHSAWYNSKECNY